MYRVGMEVLLASFLEAFSTHSRPTRKSVAVMCSFTSPLQSTQSTSSRRRKVQTVESSLASQLVAMAGTSLP